MMMDEIVFGLSMVKEYVRQVAMRNYEEANKVKAKVMQRVN
jgi:hypothetical protein